MNGMAYQTQINYLKQKFKQLEKRVNVLEGNNQSSMKSWQREEGENEIDDLREAIDTIKRWNVNSPTVKRAKDIAIASMFTTKETIHEYLYFDECKNVENRQSKLEELSELVYCYEQRLIDKGVK